MKDTQLSSRNQESGIPISVLYIDNNSSDRDLVRKSLDKEHGSFKVTEAATWEEFEARLERDKYDVVLTDSDILEFEDLRVLDAIRAKAPAVPVIIVTGTSSEDMAVEAIKQGAADYVIKTVSHIKRLPHAIRMAIEKQWIDEKYRWVEEELKQYRFMIESAQDTIFFKDLKSRYIIANDKTMEAFGMSREDVIGKNDIDIMPDKEAAKRNIEDDRKVLNTGKSKEIVKHMTGADGKEYWFQAIKTPHLDAAGNIMGLVGIARDITDQKQAEEALRKSEQEKSIILDNMSELAFHIGADMRILSANRAVYKSFKFPSDYLEGKICYEVFHNRDKICSACPVTKAMKTGQSQATSLISSFGKHWILRGYPVRDENDNITGAVEVVTEITEHVEAEEEKKKLESQLHQARKMESVGTLAGGIAHDFNNLLMAIQGNVSLALLDMDSLHPHYQRLKNVEKYVRSGADLTKQLLGFARGGKYEVKPTDLNELIKKGSAMFGRTNKEITIYRKCQKDVWTVEVDQGQIDQVLLNMYVNAWQAMPAGGELYLQTENITLDETYARSYGIKPGNYVKISVTDTGTGMDKETKEKIFDPFFTTKEMGRGVGMGLASAYGIIKNHGGVIDVYSEKDEGTTFNIYLPASEAMVSDQGTVVEEKQLLTGHETVLLVDDEDMIINVGKEILGTLGYNVISAKSGEEGIEIYRKNQDDIGMVILDMVMPGMNGGETYDNLKEINPEIKVLLSSGYSLNGQASAILKRGCDGFIQKPFTLKHISRKIREILDA